MIVSSSNKLLTVAVCTYNRSSMLVPLINSLRTQACPIPFDVLVVNNNSTDETPQVLEELIRMPGLTLRVVTESNQGIPYARNRAIDECLNSDFMLFVDDDETPLPGLLMAAVDAFERDNAQCVGGRIRVSFTNRRRPSWLGDDLLPFLGENDHGEEPFWVQDRSTPLWTGNIAYDMSIFREMSDLRFDVRYSRRGKGIGGGEDVLLFRELLLRKIRIRYRPDMQVAHTLEPWRLKRTYFLRLHFVTGLRFGQYELGVPGAKSLCGIPLFLVANLFTQSAEALRLLITRKKAWLRQTMNVSHTVGTIVGQFLFWRSSKKESSGK
jgi:glycosyltransferase involved in cell wall biosynthesis